MDLYQEQTPTNIQSRWKIAVVNGPGTGQIYPLGAVTRIGRAPTNEVPLRDMEVSRHHATVYLYDQGYAIEDQGSANGTFINGTRIDQITWIQAGDTITLGQVQLQVRGDQPVLPTQPPSAPITSTPQPTQTSILDQIPAWVLWGGILVGVFFVLIAVGGILLYLLTS